MVLGVDLGGTQVRAGLYYGGIITNKKQVYLTDKENFESTISQIKALLAPLINSSTKGIGIGVPSVVDVDAGIVYNVVNIPSWKEVRLKSILEKEYQIPVYVNNDANCFAYGVHCQKEFKKTKNLIGVTLGTGIGIGLILEGKPFFGNNCGAGELGMLPYKDKTYEMYGSSQFFDFQYDSTAKQFHKLAIAENKKALESWVSYGYHLGQFIKVVLAAYDPNAIVFGGSIAKAYQFFNTSLINSLHDFEFPQSVKHVKFFQNKMDDIALIGAAELLKKFS